MARVALLSTLRGRLLALALVGVLPSFAILGYAELNHRALLLGDVEQEAHDLARLVAERHQRAVDRARGLLAGLARLPSLRERDGRACSAELAPLLAEAPLYANVGAVLPDGTLFCSAAPLRAPVRLADRPHVRGPLGHGEFTVGGFMVSRSRGGASFGFGQPVRDARGEVVAVAVASFDLAQLQGELDALHLPAGAEAVVVDRDGLVITARPDPGARLGRPADPSLLAALSAGGPAELEGADGLRRMFGFHEVRGAFGDVAMRVAVGMPAAAARGEVDRIVRNSTLALLAAALLAAALAVFGGELLVVRRLRAVVAASRRIAAGDHAARTGLAPGRDEVGDLVRSFDEMAGSLERLSRQNRLLLDAVGEGVVGLDARGQIMFVNPAATRSLGWAQEELLGKDAHATLHCRAPDGSALPAERCPFLRAIREGHACQGSDEVLCRRDGTTFPVDYVSTPIVDAGEVVGGVLVFRDASERRRIEERLRQAEKMEAVGQLAGGVAHDFNNLLTAIVSCAHLVREGLAPDHPSQPDVQEIEVAAARATALTRQLLTFSRRQRVAPRTVELRAVVRGMESMLRRLLPENVRLSVDGAAAGTVTADPAQIEMAVLNLAVNARDAMPAGGRIVVRVEELERGEPGEEGLPEGPLAVLSVKDEGTGIDPGARERIFEPFFTTKPQGKGTGLGLSTVYGIVSQSGGSIRVRSQPGRGAEFRVYLPLRTGARAEPLPVPAAPPPGAGADAETVLVVEDDAAIRGVARRTLSRAGYRVLDAASPGEALRLAAGEEVDLLLTDVVLPGQDGWALSRELVRGRPALRVLFMSGYAAQPSGEPLLPDGAPMLAKPFAPEDLLRGVRAVLDGALAQGAADASSGARSAKRSA